MSFENYKRFYYDSDNGTVLRPKGKGKSFRFPLEVKNNKSYRLFVTGETGLFYQWKNEPDHPEVYRSITDSLYSDEAEIGAFALSFSSENAEKYVRRVHKKIVWEPRLSYLDLVPLPEKWNVGFYVKAEDLKINTDFGGYLRMRVNVRYIKEGVSIHSNENLPDYVYIIDVPEGSYGYVKLERDIDLPKGKIASVGIFIEGVNYSGRVFVESPFFIGNGYNILPDFAPAVQGKSHFDWTGQYFSRKEWPSFRVSLNGSVIFEDEVFERCHRDSEWEIDLPRDLLKEENEVSLELISDCHDPLPYTVHEMGVIEQESGERAALIAVSEIGTAGGYAYALIRTEIDGVSLESKTDGKIDIPKSLYFECAGLHGIKIECKAPAHNAHFELYDGEITLHGTVSYIAERGNDGVYTGTGDMIYVHGDIGSAEEYLSWYISEGIGNLLTIRPSYRWSGTRTLDRDMWREVARVLNEWDMLYPHMLDGRELEGLNANPDAECIAGKGFGGRQLHERDGAMFYWGRYARSNDIFSEQVADMYVEICREDPEHSNPISDGRKYVYVGAPIKTKKDTDSTVPTFDGDETDTEKRYCYKNPNIEKDMRVGHDYTLKRLRETKADDATRHTGPSVTFKYFLEAGYKWVGAETMYGTLEEIMAFLRGATLSYGISDMGVHHALQWSSSPHDAPEHARRYRLALYNSYMQGATEINTEEGLWRLEEYFSRFNRFSDACVMHKKEQQDFYRYVKSHTRRGKFYTPMALVHGRYDGFHGFARNSFWGYKDVEDTDAEKSWDLLDVFYPEGTLGDPTYCHNCPTDRAMGFYSSTPLGNIDAIPMENENRLFFNYRAVAFMGYNCFDEADSRYLNDYVSSGGSLLLTCAHLSGTTDYLKIKNNEIDFTADPFGITDGAVRNEEKTVSGVSVSAVIGLKEPDKVFMRADDGTPIGVTYKIGEGTVSLFTVLAYPAHKAIASAYRNQLAKQMENAQREENVWVSSDSKIEFALYRHEDETDVYFIAVDWYRAPSLIREASLRIGKNEHRVALPFGVMIKAAVWEDFAAYPHSENAEVISVRGGMARIQGTGKARFTFIHGDRAYDKEINFDASPLCEINI